MELSRVRVVLSYRSFAQWPGISHAGLGISSTSNYKTLRQNGVTAFLKPLTSEQQMRLPLDNDADITHLIVSAPWVSTNQWGFISDQFPHVEFAVICHSQTGFLQAEPGAIRLLRQQMALETFRHNFHVAGNSPRFCRFVRKTYQVPCTLLPNMYYLDSTSRTLAKPRWPQNGGVLRVGLFGAPRVQKNMTTAAAGILMAAQDLGARTEIWMNSGRDDGGDARRIFDAVSALTEGLPNITLQRAPWGDWSEFRRLVGTMDILVNCSYSETFNMVTADGISRGIPSVVSRAIGWAPPEWQADCDDEEAIARVLVSLLYDPAAPQRGLEALQAHNASALDTWLAYLTEGQFGRADARWEALGPKAYSTSRKT